QIARRTRMADEAGQLAAWEKALPKCVGNVLKALNRTRYDHDAHGNLIRKTEPGGVTWLYAYDAANRLKRADRYAKPPAANEIDRLERTQDGTAFIPGTVRPALQVRFEYDAFGRRTLKEAGRPDGSLDRTVFTWDGDVLLMEERFHLPPRQPGEREPLTYRPVQIVREDPDDADALPVAQRMHTLSERHQWQGASLYLHEPGTFVPLARLDETLVEAAFIATGTDGRFVQVPAKTRHATLFYQNDHLGTPQELLDESGKVVWLGRYRAWGAEKTVWQAQPERHEAGNPTRFQGQYHDDETGLHYNRYRYYDPNCGRFISKDPIGFAGGINVYQYAPSPIQWIDPLGLAKTTCDLYAFGNASGPRDPRIAGVNRPLGESGDLTANAEGMVGPTIKDGASTFGDPNMAPVSGVYYKIPTGTELPDGIDVVADGKEVGGKHAETHHTICPKKKMKGTTFIEKFKSLPWIRAGKK
ncbi:RHS repeat domain-containing protein, partial [Burkholderia ubonensis]|uniref:RHS repeat domain-containing protein n=1 Tax=Burkholderia ubonensis TaxID=101571 RepID=UPI000A868373